MPFNVTRLSTFVASIRKSMLTRSPTRKVRATEAFIENWDGPVMKFRGALPHSPVAGAVNAAMLAYDVSTVGSGDTPVRLGRVVPMMPVRPTGTSSDAVTGVPLPVVIWLVNVQSLNSAPFMPSMRVPPRMPAPVVYSNVEIGRAHV